MPKPSARPVEYGHHYLKVPRLGTVIFSPDVVTRLMGTPHETWEVEQVLELGTDVKAPPGLYWSGSREYNGLRLVFKTRPHLKGAVVVCIDGYRVKP